MTAALPTPAALFAAMEATWPAAAAWRLGPWWLRDGAGGGKRASAATIAAGWTPDDIGQVEAAMPQGALFLLRPEDAALDAALSARGYAIVDPVLTYAACTADFAAPPHMATFAHWPPLQIAVDLWADGQIGPARLAVMQRAPGPKAAILARLKDRAVGVAYVALHADIALLHALQVSPAHRRQGSAQNLLAAAAHWAADHGAATLALIVTTANLPARALYERLGMHPLGGYHYRQQVPR